MALEHIPTMSVEEYFALDENSPDTRYEYLDGYVYMMSGGSANHATSGGNIHALLKGLPNGPEGPCFLNMGMNGPTLRGVMGWVLIPHATFTQ